MNERHAALKLHGMENTDREWILSQLGESARARLYVYLEELDRLGIPPQSLQQPKVDSSPLGALITAEPTHICAIFDTEPAWMLVQLLRLRSWPWERALLASLDAKRRAAIIDELRQQESQALPPALADALLHASHARLADHVRSTVDMAARQTAAKRPSFFDRAMQWRR
ncbi:hypothetical protein [Chitinimonas sp. BJB300]|uniref:hypothetical protein n=1 Tax=Chitinimonas sp. BJB300 TaxID=1559339 RepID=UPI000C1174F4|nr:hypothetical protein [Chitinimonas sp. BJB300]PHV12874.1 hypothetical protein CSQ89_03525 [Chitinimonas sp. BJB300]TSJ86094.1 hypothetical protein FG002_016315 [Chitinimonas sp. BJB300]